MYDNSLAFMYMYMSSNNKQTVAFAPPRPPLKHTFLQYFQMLPQDVADEGRRSRQEGFAPEPQQLLARHREVVELDAL